MTSYERLVLENQNIIMHALRALLWQADCPGPAREVQNQMDRTHDTLRDATGG